jgi:hypothetical protein
MAPLSPLVESFSIITQLRFALWHNKMAAPLSVCTKREQRAWRFIFFVSEVVTGAEIHRRLSAQYGVVLCHQDHQWRRNSTVNLLREKWCSPFSGDSQGVTMERYLERHATVNKTEACNSNQKIRPTVDMCSVAVWQRAHILTSTMFKLLWNWVSRCWTILHTVPISLRDYHLFGRLKDAVRVHRYTSNEEVEEAVHEWLTAQSKTFCLRTSRSLWNAGISVLKSKGTMLKNDIILRSLIFMK